MQNMTTDEAKAALKSAFDEWAAIVNQPIPRTRKDEAKSKVDAIATLWAGGSARRTQVIEDYYLSLIREFFSD